MSKRAIRRAHRARLKKARRFHLWHEYDAQELSRLVDTPKPCSCWMCGNPRRYFGTEHVSLLSWLQPKLHQE